MNRWLFIDGGFLCAQARFTTGMLSNEDMPTGIVFGFLNKILFLHKHTEIKNFVFAWDSQESYRRKIYKEYKANRVRNLSQEELADKQAYYAQVNHLREAVLPTLGFKNCFYQKGLEADDIIAQASLQLKNGLIVSSDQDLYQLLTDNVAMLIPAQKGQPRLYTKSDFELEFRLSPRQWWKVKALMGCASDNVRGITGIGPISAIQYLKKEIGPGNLKYDLIKKNWDIVKRNAPLVRLPHRKTKSIKTQDDDLSLDKFKKLCEEMSFHSFLEGPRAGDWIRFFGNSKNKIRERLNK